jgi:asparagine synthase (glutamine-hydrolysing)
MCGIIGIASSRPIEKRAWLAAGRDAMRHRGPDDVGEWWAPNGFVGLGHRRLAIIDLSAAGHQPMLDDSGELVMVFNGEIYNFAALRAELASRGHAFRSVTDTEVVLAAYREWGTSCLQKLEGMFALAIYDARVGQLFLARDRAGEKPLYYVALDGEIRFASEIKALLADESLPRVVDRSALDCYLAEGFVPSDRSIFRDVRKVPPAHALIFDVGNGKSRVWRYWRPPDFASEARSEDELVDELDSLLASAVRRQLVADVPVGVLLSGGVDSSLITAFAARAASNVKTFTVRFPGYGKYDETEHARLIAARFETEHLELEADAIGLDTLPVLARQFDEPLIDSSMIPTYLVTRLVRAHCTVALGGDGGDELFGGYAHYDRLLYLQRTFGWIPRAIRIPAARLAAMVLPPGFKGRNWLQGLATDLNNSVPMIASYFDLEPRRALVSGHDGWPFVAESLRERHRPPGGDLLQRATRLDFENYLPEDILVKVDRASMLNSLEVRAPMLDVPVIEFAFRKVPSELKATRTTRKVLLKRLAARLLPSEFDRMRKQGFSIPLSTWLRSGPWRTYFEEVLLDDGQSTFDRNSIRALLDGQRRGRSNSERLFGLLMFELWRREYRVTLDA